MIKSSKEILQETLKNVVYAFNGDIVGDVNANDIIKAMEAYHSQFPSQGLREVIVTMTADGEIGIYRKDSDGTRYLIIDEDEISLVFTGGAGDYKTLHHSNGVSFKELVDGFNQTSTPDGSQGLREALEKFVQAVENAPLEWLPTVELNDAYDLATEALKNNK